MNTFAIAFVPALALIAVRLEDISALGPCLLILETEVSA